MYDNMFHNYSDKRRLGIVHVSTELQDKLDEVLAMCPIIKATGLNGVHYIFPTNGVTVSVQWGFHNYGDHYWDVFSPSLRFETERRTHSNTAEVYIWVEDDSPKYSHRFNHKNVMAITGIFAVCEIQDTAGYQSVWEVLNALNMAGSWQNTAENRAAIYTTIRERDKRMEQLIYGTTAKENE